MTQPPHQSSPDIATMVEMLPPLRQLVSQADLAAKKSLGQNFLFDLNLTRRIARTAAPFDDAVLEIGPGPGGLSRALLIEGAPQLITVEKDKRIIEFLQHLQQVAADRLILIEQDALELRLSDITTSPLQIVANLPYNIATPLFISFLRQAEQISAMSLMFQKEVAMRITAKVGDSAYGRLAVITAWRAAAEMLFDIPADAFVPPPKVTSTLIRVTPYPKPLFDCKMEHLEAVTRIAFGQRRKMLRASFKQFGGEDFLSSLDIDPSIRPQQLPVEGFCRIANALADQID